MKWSDLLWGRVTLTAATVGLAIAGSVGDSSRPWAWIFGLAGFIVLHAIIGWFRDRKFSNRVRQNYEEIQTRVLHLISDLSNLTAREFDLWMVDLYLPQSFFTLSTRSPFFRNQKLVRELSIALTDVRTVPLEIDMNHELFGSCFSYSRPGLWWDQTLAQTHIADGNLWHDLDEEVNNELRRTYGIVSVNPLVDALGRHCLGLLVVHTRRDSEVATKALGALAEPEGVRRLVGACRDIHSQLAK